jgi:hypothetical protein
VKQSLVLYMVMVVGLVGCALTPVERTSANEFRVRPVYQTRECDPPPGWDKAAAWAKGTPNAHTKHEQREARVEYSTRGSSYSGLDCEFRIEAGSSSEVRREWRWR